MVRIRKRITEPVPRPKTVYFDGVEDPYAGIPIGEAPPGVLAPPPEPEIGVKSPKPPETLEAEEFFAGVEGYKIPPVKEPDMPTALTFDPEKITTKKVRGEPPGLLQPYQVLAKMKEGGATVAEQYAYIQKHPDAARGTSAKIAKSVYETLQKTVQLTGEEAFAERQKLGFVPKEAEYDPTTGGYYTLAIARDLATRMIGLGLIERRTADTYLKTKTPVAGLMRHLGDVEQKQARKLAKFEKEHIKLADGQWMLISDWNKLPEDLQTIGLRQGYDAMVTATEVESKEYKEFQAQLASGEIIKLPKNNYVAKTEFEKLPEGTQDILKKQGFEGLEALEKKVWEDVRTGKIISDEEHSKLKGSELDYYHLSVPSGKRLLTQIASFIVPPARAALPEYTVKDIRNVEWALGAVNTALIATAFAPGAILGTLAGKVTVTGISTTGAGLISYETARNWADLTPVQRGVGVGATVLYSIPALATVARGIKISTVKIPTAKDIPTWRGLSIAQHPIIGRSGGRWVVGARNITLPEARLILEGYKPEVMLETKVFVNVKALRQAGLSQTQVNYLTDSLRARNLFAGKKSPFLAKEALIEPTQRLTVDEINVLLRQINKYNKQVKQVDMLYGSATIKAQLAPELRSWRAVHDWDISTNMSLTETEVFTKEILKELLKLGKGKYRISPKSPTLIEKRIGNKWEHIADIHSREVTPGIVSPEIPKSKLDITGDYSYGRMVAEPTITVKYPGVGKFDIMALSESGVRKADTILRVRQTPEGTAFLPPKRGIAQPGVPKDAADFYVILRTFKGEDIAEDWLRSWAKSMGYTTKELARVLPNIRRAMLEVAGKTPTNLIGYRFTPASTVRVPTGASPTITVHIPSSLGASVSGSLARQISSPISPYSVPPSTRASVSISVASLASQMPSVKPPVKLPSVSAIVSQLSVAPKPSPTPPPKPSVSVKPSLYPSVKVSISPVPSPKPSPPLVPSPKPSLVPKPIPKPPIQFVTIKGKKRAKLPTGSITWQQGMIWKYIPPPWTQRKPLTLRHAPIGAVGTGTPAQTIQMIGKPRAKVPKSVSIDLGIADILITESGRAIAFTGKGEETVAGQGIPGTTTGMSIPATAPMKVSRIRGTDEEALKKLAFGTSMKSLLREDYRADIPRKFAEKALVNKLGKMKPKEIANEIKKAGIGKSRIAEVVRHLPDRERDQVLMRLEVEELGYVPVRGYPKPVVTTSKIRRKKRKTNNKQRLVPMAQITGTAR